MWGHDGQCESFVLDLVGSLDHQPWTVTICLYYNCALLHRIFKMLMIVRNIHSAKEENDTIM